LSPSARDRGAPHALEPGTGGSSYRTTARKGRDNTLLTSWRNDVDVDVIAESDTPEWPYDHAAYCRAYQGQKRGSSEVPGRAQRAETRRHSTAGRGARLPSGRGHHVCRPVRRADPAHLARSQVGARRHSLFYHRSIAMGWLDDRSAGGGVEDHLLRAPGLWGMNDAGWNHPLAVPGTGLVSWFQVDASAPAGDRPLPVQPFLRCATDATAWAGTLHLSAIQILLPVQGLDAALRPPYAPVPAMRTVGWFAERDPRSRTPVEVSVNSGGDPSIRAVAQQLTEHLAHLEQDVFVCTSHDLAGRDAGLPPPFDDGLGTARRCTAWCCAASWPSGRVTRSGG
jgi:hypothetical protein